VEFAFMSNMLQAIAEQDKTHLDELVATFESESRDLDALPEPRRLARAVAAAKAIVRRVPWAADIVGEWVEDLEGRLRDGMNGQEFRVLAGSGALLLKTCFALTELADRLWTRADSLGADANDVEAGRQTVSETTQRLLAVKPRIDQLAKFADRKPPEIEPSAIERGMENIRQGCFLTPEQARQAVRKTG